MAKISVICATVIVLIFLFIKNSSGDDQQHEKTPPRDVIKKNNLTHYKNALFESDVQNLKACLINDGEMVDYKKAKKVIDHVMKRYFSDYHWEKVRISCKSSNKIDAAKLHRDVISNDYSAAPNIFHTIVIYLQDSSFGFIPYSNYSHSIHHREKIINTSCRDIIMFDSTSLHRGIFSENPNEKRTCIQIFNVVHKKNIAWTKLLANTVLSNNALEKMLYSPFLHQFDKRKVFNPISNGTDNLLLMIEGGSRRTPKDIDKQNLYYMNRDFPANVKTITSNLKKKYRFL